MENSDSENFESADEDFDSSGEEPPKPPVQTPETISKDVQIIETHFPNVSISSPDNKNRENNFEAPKSDENLWEDDELNWSDEEPVPKPVEKGVEPSMWDDSDDWEAVEPPKAPADTWGTWGSSWTSMLTTGVSSLTQGLSTALESGIGVPDPAELARLNHQERAQLDQPADSDSPRFGLGHLVKFVESTGTKVIAGGLDTLETIGKKTMEVLQEGDPGLKKKRAFLQLQTAPDRPVLSQLLREAKEKTEEENRRENSHRRVNYESLFDDHHGLVHLEALEMLSKQCDIKLQGCAELAEGGALKEMQETMEQVRELCELPEDEEESTFGVIKVKLETAVEEMGIGIGYGRLVDTWTETEEWLERLKLDVCDGGEIHSQAIETLAQLTAIAVEQFHKCAELLLVKEHRSTADEADSLVQLTSSLVALMDIVASQFSSKLNAKSAQSKNDGDETNSLITNVFFEAGNSKLYIQNAFQLLIPVLQVGAI